MSFIPPGARAGKGPERRSKRGMQYRIVNRRNEKASISPAMGPGRMRVKRGMDILLSLTGMAVCSPLFLLVAAVMAVHWRGCPFFCQERVGRGGRIFRIYKFRTMPDDAEARGPQLTAADDARLTPLERFVRSRHLDELPQLWNVLAGDMSMVGYRPERACFVERIMAEDPRYACLLCMRPGVTSEATLYNGYTDTMEKMLVRLNMDLQYLETATLRKDVQIMFRTVLTLFRSEDKQ